MGLITRRSNGSIYALHFSVAIKRNLNSGESRLTFSVEKALGWFKQRTEWWWFLSVKQEEEFNGDTEWKEMEKEKLGSGAIFWRKHWRNALGTPPTPEIRAEESRREL